MGRNSNDMDMRGYGSEQPPWATYQFNGLHSFNPLFHSTPLSANDNRNRQQSMMCRGNELAQVGNGFQQLALQSPQVQHEFRRGEKNAAGHQFVPPYVYQQNALE
jgi:hypothetical protein